MTSLRNAVWGYWVTDLILLVSMERQSPPCTNSIAMYKDCFDWNALNMRTNISLILTTEYRIQNTECVYRVGRDDNGGETR